MKNWMWVSVYVFILLVNLGWSIYLQRSLVVADTLELELVLENRRLRRDLDDRTRYEMLPILCTVYHPVSAQTDSTPLITATGRLVTEKTVAVSPKLQKYLPLGTRILSDGEILIVDDVTSPKNDKLQVDRCFFDTSIVFKDTDVRVLVPYKYRPEEGK